MSLMYGAKLRGKAVQWMQREDMLQPVTFCRKVSNVYWWSFADHLHSHHMLLSPGEQDQTVVSLYLLMIFLLT